jgi:hypothetical protein
MPGSSTTPRRPGTRIARPSVLPSTSVLPSMSMTMSAPGIIVLSRLNTWPVRTPVNASLTPSRVTAHECRRPPGVYVLLPVVSEAKQRGFIP